MSTSEIVHWCREMIRHGRFVAGQRLIESDVMRESGASRNRVRDAFQRLASEGLVTIEEFRGASVRIVSQDEVRHIHQARAALEGFAARCFAEEDDAKGKERLEKLQKKMDECVENTDFQRFSELNTEWHDLIIASLDNPYFMQFLSRLTIPLHQLLASSVFLSVEKLSQSNNEHNRVTAAILAGDAARAEKMMRAHIDSAMTKTAADFETGLM